MKRFVHAFVLLFLFSISNAFAQKQQVKSPNGKIEVNINTKGQIGFSVKYEGNKIISDSPISMLFADGTIWGKKAKLKSKKTASVNATLAVAVPTKASKLQQHYNELVLKFNKPFTLTFRVYDNGVAYRFGSTKNQELVVKDETFALNFPSETQSFFPKEDSFISHNERIFIPTKIDTLSENDFCSMPVLFKSKGINVLLTDADLHDYPALFMKGNKSNSLKATFPHFVKKATPKKGTEDRDQDLEYEDFIAKTSGKRNFPWRVLTVAKTDAALAESNLVYLLSRPSKIENPSWIKPGRVAWDWYNACNIYGVDFEAGINTQTYKYYIDFASKFGLEYIILDEGWTLTSTNIRETNPNMDVAEIIRYGKEKNVGIILWTLWGPLAKDLSVLELYEKWGAKGIKVDFMQRSDQEMVNFYENTAKKAAEHHLLVDYHGCFKPAGLRRTYPNVISYEAVKGNENNKWSQEITPEHNVTLPFTRMVVGPMDYTPGAMRNAQEKNHASNFMRPMSMGTRAHQVAMYVVFESPLQMLCDAPSTYYKEEETTKFIAQIPSVWDETKILDGKVGDYIVVARRKGQKWFVGAMTDGSAREIEIDLSFLGKSPYEAEIFSDGRNAHNFAEDYRISKKNVSASDKLKVKLAPGGGWAAVLTIEE